ARAIHDKAQAEKAVLDMITMLKTQTRNKVKAIKTDNGGVYRSNAFLEALRGKGIALKASVPYHSETNSVAEIANKTIYKMARTTLIHAKLPKYLWVE